MSSEIDPDSALPPPDRVCGRGLLVFAALALGTSVALQALAWHGAARDAAAAEHAALAAEQAALAGQIVVRLDRLAEAGDGEEAALERSLLHWDLDRLLAREADPRAAAGLQGLAADAEDDRQAMLRTMERIAGAEGGVAPAEALRLRGVFEAEILPALSTSARATRAAAVEAGQRRSEHLLAAGAAQLLLLCGAGVLLGRRTRRRIRTWLARSAEAAESARQRLLHDPLTRLPNATYLDGYLSRLLAEPERQAGAVAVLHLELARFEDLSAALGRRSGIAIVEAAAIRVQQCLRGGDFAAHLGQETFVVVATDLAEPGDAAVVAQRLHRTLSRPFAVRGHSRRIDCHIGVALVSDGDLTPERLLANASVALGEARQASTGSIRYYSDHMRVEVERRETLCGELMEGLERGEVVPFFQPQVALGTRELVGFEALARWQHPTRGTLAPPEWLEIAEKAGLIERLGEVMLEAVLEALSLWDRQKVAVPSVGINFALAQLRDPSMIERIKWEVDRRSIEPSRLSIEVLETVLVRGETDLVVRNLQGLAATGFRVELDDFGTGHASISNVRRFKAERIKIDRSFVRGIETSDEQLKLVASIVAMARALGIRTLAEGVETAEEEAALRELGCDEVQGYRIARPMPLADATAWLAAHCDGAHPPAASAARRAATAR
jgi:diguanylate cyclase